MYIYKYFYFQYFIATIQLIYFTALTFCSAAVGVAVGYIVGGQTLGYFVDIDKVPQSAWVNYRLNLANNKYILNLSKQTKC